MDETPNGATEGWLMDEELAKMDGAASHKDKEGVGKSGGEARPTALDELPGSDLARAESAAVLLLNNNDYRKWKLL